MTAPFFIRHKYDNREDWLKARTGLGGSDAGVIVGANRWKHNTRLYDEIIGVVEPEDISDKPVVKYGTQCEPLLRQLFALTYPEYDVYSHDYEILQNTTLPFLQASLDGELTAPDGRKGILEIKTTTVWHPRYLDNWEEQIPESYYCQILHYMLVTRYTFAIVTALINLGYTDDKQQLIKHYFFDRKDCEDDMRYLLNKEIEFWQHVERREKPELILSAI